MSLLSTHNLAKSFGPLDIFRNVTVAVPRAGRMALVGPNGAGKTTFLRILVGLEEASRGTVARAKGLRLGYLPQESDWSGQGTLWDEMLSAFTALREQEAELSRLEAEISSLPDPAAPLQKYGRLQEQFELAGGYEYENRIQSVLTGLGFEAEDYGRPLTMLSGGQKTRAHLGRLLLEDPDLLVLDEPTNHLDFAAVEWLEGWLADWNGAALVVSHDRYFMDRVAETIWQMQDKEVQEYSGNYTAYLAQRAERQARQEVEYEAQRAFVAKTEDYIRRNIAGQNTSQAKGRLRRLERLKSTGLIDRPRKARRLHLNIKSGARSGDRVLETHGLKVGYQDDKQILFQAPDVLLWRGECAALIGPNGAGKTTLLRTLLGELPPLGGRVKMGANLQVGYFAQAHESLRPERTVMEEIWSVKEMPIGQARDYLARFLFTGDSVFKPVDVLSGGERGRLALAKLALQGANFLLLDEPTNHLDIPSQEVLEAVLADFEGTILLVSHDRYLIDALATQIWSVEAGRLNVFKGNYGEWVAAREAAGSNTNGESKRKPQVSDGKAPVAAAEPKAERAKRSPRGAKAGPNQKRLSELELVIASLERRLGEISVEIETAGAALERVRALGAEYAQVEADLNRHLEEWTDVAEG